MAIKFQDSLEVKGGSASKIYLEGAGGTGSSTILQAYNPDDGAGHAGGTAYLKSSGWGEAQLAVGSYRWTQAGGKMTVTGGVYYFNTGNVGIGTGSPSSKLTVAGRVDFQNDLRLRGTDSSANQGVVRFYVDDSNKLYIDTANDGNNKFSIDSTGNVGIGTEDASSRLHIYQNAAAPTLLTLHNYQGDITPNGTQGNFIDLKMTDNNATFTPQVRIGMLVQDYDGDQGMPSEGTGNFVVYTGDGTDSSGNGTLTEKLRVTHQGAVGINQSNPEHRLDIVSSSANVLGLTNTSGGTGTTITFNDNHTANQRVYLTAHHVDSQSHGGGASLHLTSTEANVTMVSERYKSIQHGDSSQWSAAYSWGDHSAVGYLRTRPEVHTALYSTGGNADEYTEFGIYRNYGEGNPPSLGHNTLLNVMQTNGNYGWQITSSTAAGGDSMWYRQKGADWGDGTWYQIASREWVGSQEYLTSLPAHTHSAADITSGTLDGARLPWNSGNDGFTGTYPLVWKSGDLPWTASWLTVNGQLDQLNSRRFGSYGGDTAVLFQSYNASASNAEQFRIRHNYGNVDIANPRGQILFETRADFETTVVAQTDLYVGSFIQHWGDGGTGMYFNTDSVDIRTNSVTRIEFNNSGVSIPSDVYFTGNSRKIYLTGGDTDSQNGWVVGEQDRYGFGTRWNSGSSLEFEGWWSKDVTTASNRSLGSVNVDSRIWNFSNSVRVNGYDVATQAWVEEQPPAPAAASCAVVGDTIEVSFDPAPESPDYYQVWASQDGGSYSLIAQIPTQDFSPFMTVIDTSFSVSGLRAYRVYAVRRGIYSDPATTSRTYTQAALEPVNMNVVPMEESFFVQWDAPASRFVDHYEVYLDTHEDQGSLNRNNANLVYSGNNTFYMHPTSTNEFHQFWVEIAES